MPKVKNKEVRFKILNECLRDPYQRYGYENLLEELNRQLQLLDLPVVSQRTLKYDIEDMKAEYGIELDKELLAERPAVLRYADMSNSIYRLSPEESNALRKTIDTLLEYPKPRPLQYDYIRICLQQIVKNNQLHVERPSVQFTDNLDHQGREFFVDLCRYIMERSTAVLKYKPYTGEAFETEVSPFILKQYNERWFLVCGDCNDVSLRVYPLDRIQEMRHGSKEYDDCTIDIESHFDEVIGITVLANKPTVRVRLKVQSKRYPYIETKPLHSSQRVINSECTKDYKVIEIRVRINFELESKILSFGDDIEVLEPTELRDNIKNKIKNLYIKYNCVQ